MELLNKPIIHLNHIDDTPKYNLEISESIPEYLLDNKIYQKLNKYKNMGFL